MIQRNSVVTHSAQRQTQAALPAVGPQQATTSSGQYDELNAKIAELETDIAELESDVDGHDNLQIVQDILEF